MSENTTDTPEVAAEPVEGTVDGPQIDADEPESFDREYGDQAAPGGR